MTEIPKKILLGEKIPYPKRYAPEILVPLPRNINRESISIETNNLPFVGVDVWHAYEFSFLTNYGLPVAGIIKMVVPADSPFLVESKSLKLYLNSFNMERYGNNSKEGVLIILNTIRNDLNKILKTDIKISYFEYQNKVFRFDFSDYLILENNLDGEIIEYKDFNEKPELLISEISSQREIKFATHLIRTNCKITQQPDWGSAYIYMKGTKTPSKDCLLKYLVSMRNENHFHEEICEMIYQRLNFFFAPDDLMVTCIYSRRGGIDICPTRASSSELLPKYLSECNQLSYKLLRQ